jgi:hypothetical protein
MRKADTGIGLSVGVLSFFLQPGHGFGAPVPMTNICTAKPPIESAPSAGGVAGAPLIVAGTSHVVVMEYEAWFGPRTGIAPQSNITTCLQTADMQAMGGGYDSRNPGVIAQHIKWLERAGIDAVTLDLTNNVSCIFDGDNPEIIAQVCPNAAFHASNLAIRSNDGNLYAAWNTLGTRLKIIPLLGGFDTYAVTPDTHDPKHRTALQKEVEWFGALMRTNPGLSIVYQGKPLMLVYLGTPIDTKRVEAIRALLSQSGLDERYTLKLIGGYLDSQPQFWADPDETPTGPIKIAPRFGFWSIVDRLNFWGAPPHPYYPTFNDLGPAIENMTASLATAGQTGWICPPARTLDYCPDAALRYCGAGYQNGCDPGVYETLEEFMAYARSLKPIFLIIDQLNEFEQPDEGPNAMTNDDAEPTKQWAYSGLKALIGEMQTYRAATSASPPP